MEGVFTLPYSEYDVINKMTTYFKKKHNFGFYVPTSRQQKGVDFLLMNHYSGKVARVQVKASRSWFNGNEHFFWFNNFLERYEENTADYYILYGMYPQLKKGEKVNSKAKSWSSVILCFSEKEMFEFLKQVKTKKEEKTDKFFGFKFSDPKRIVTGRGFRSEIDISEFLLANYSNKIMRKLE